MKKEPIEQPDSWSPDPRHADPQESLQAIQRRLGVGVAEAMRIQAELASLQATLRETQQAQAVWRKMFEGSEANLRAAEATLTTERARYENAQCITCAGDLCEQAQQLTSEIAARQAAEATLTAAQEEVRAWIDDLVAEGGARKIGPFEKILSVLKAPEAALGSSPAAKEPQ